ncbi:hypothetical protein Misp01_32090 [Microtetraspora sp. NBRC 13810]|nr:hypothetical protein Misp01_32090 [Microtetraspora sp. NBRC 13810]
MSVPENNLPPELLNGDPDGFAWQVWHERTPRLIERLKDAHPAGPGSAALDGLLTEIFSGVMEPLGPHAHDRDLWASWGAAHFGKPWMDAPFLWSESYFYRRILDAVGFFESGPAAGADPFGHLKAAELTSGEMARDLAALEELRRLPAAESGRAKLLAALWGNRADLSFRLGHAASLEERLVADDGDPLWAAFGPAADVVVVADNAGRELVADLVLIDHLLAHDLAASVTLHLKPHPYYVSDATAHDLDACLDRLAGAGGEAREVARRLGRAADTGAFTPEAHDFSCSPWSYRRLPDDLAARFRAASVTVMKGDLNYRRLVGDRAWPPGTPFAAATAYFPGTVAALRTLKSDVVVGIAPATLAALDAASSSWRVDGGHGLLQFRP